MHSREVNTERARTKEERKAKKGSRSAKKRSTIAVASWHPQLLRNYRSEFVQVPPLEPREAADGLGVGYVPADIVFFCCSVLSNSFCGLTPQVVLMSTTAAGVRRRNTKVLCKNL